MGQLTTHILDTAHGMPAVGVSIRLYALGEQREMVANAESNADGRTEYPLLDAELMVSGSYELEFDTGTYYRKNSTIDDDPAFLETVVIRITVKGDENYHVPLLCSPWSYSTYRGS